MKKLSIIMPVYNGEKFLKKSIDSVLKSTYSNLELIIINDGSTDDSLRICESMARGDGRVLIVDQKNQGAGETRNKGLSVATGDYITFVDSDDYVDRNMYSEMLKIMEINDDDIIQCGYYEVNEEGKIIGKSKMPVKKVDNDIEYEYRKLSSFSNHVWNKIFKREILTECRFPELSYSEDQCFLVQAFFKAKRVENIENRFYYYVINENSLVHSEFSKKRMDTLVAGDIMYDFYQKKDNSDMCENIADYIVSYVILLNYYLSNSNYQNKDEIKNVIDDYYQRYKDEAKRSRLHQERKTNLSFLLFSLSPKLSAIFLKFMNK